MTVSFTRLDRATKEDMKLLYQGWDDYEQGLLNRLIKALLRLRGNTMGARIDRFEHSLQVATRALRDGADEETLVCALLHDIGDDLAPLNHGQLAAAVLRPYVSPANAWLLENHEVFEGYHFYHLIGEDCNKRDKLRDHPAFEKAVIFGDRWDQVSFDPDYDTLPLSAFIPTLEKFFSQQGKVAVVDPALLEVI